MSSLSGECDQSAWLVACSAASVARFSIHSCPVSVNENPMNPTHEIRHSAMRPIRIQSQILRFRPGGGPRLDIRHSSSTEGATCGGAKLTGGGIGPPGLDAGGGVLGGGGDGVTVGSARRWRDIRQVRSAITAKAIVFTILVTAFRTSQHEILILLRVKPMQRRQQWVWNVLSALPKSSCSGEGRARRAGRCQAG